MNGLKFRRNKPKGYLESNDLYQFLSDQAHTSPEKILGQTHEIQYLLYEIQYLLSLCDNSQVLLVSGQTKTSAVPRQAGTGEKRLVGGLSLLGQIPLQLCHCSNLGTVKSKDEASTDAFFF